MPGGSSRAKDEPDRVGTPSSLLGVTGGPAGSVNQGNLHTDSVMELPAVMHATASVSDGVHWWEKYSLLIHIFTGRDRQGLESHAWVEDLVKRLFPVYAGNQCVGYSFEPNQVPHFLW